MNATHTSQAYRVKVVRLERASPRYGLDGWWVNFRCDNTDAFADAVEAVKGLSHVYRAWDKTAPGGPAWWVADVALPDLARDITDIMTYKTRWRGTSGGGTSNGAGTGNGGQQRKEAPPPQPPPRRAPIIPPDVQDAFDKLYLLPSAPKEIIEAARRVMAKMHHPDLGGDLVAMKAINTAADKALEWAGRRKAA